MKKWQKIKLMSRVGQMRLDIKKTKEGAIIIKNYKKSYKEEKLYRLKKIKKKFNHILIFTTIIINFLYYFDKY